MSINMALYWIEFDNQAIKKQKDYYYSKIFVDIIENREKKRSKVK